MLLHPFVSFRVSMFHDRVVSIRAKMFVFIRVQGRGGIPDVEMGGEDGIREGREVEQGN